MSRNGNGTYNLPAGNPVVTGTTISSTWANNTLADIANAITGSIAADGQTPITGALKGTNGTVTFAGVGQTRIPVGTTAQRAATPLDGMIRYNTDLQQYEGYKNGAWSIFGNGAGGTLYSDTVTATQGQTVITMPTGYVLGGDNLSVYVNGSRQIYNVNYTETTTTSFTFANGLNVGDLVNYTIGASTSLSVNASSVLYNEGGTGAVNRNVEQKLQEYVSVLDFGADNTGATDSTTAFNNAIAANNSVFIPKGTYKVNLILSTDNVTLFGEGIGNTILKPNAVGPVITLNGDLTAGMVQTNISKLSINGVDKSGHGISVINTLDANGCDYLNFSDIQIFNCLNGLNVTGRSIWNKFYNCNFLFNKTGIYVVSALATNEWNFVGCTTNFNDIHGLYLNSSEAVVGAAINWSFTNFNSEQNGADITQAVCYGVYLENTLNFVFNGLYLENNGANLTSQNSYGLRATGNVCRGFDINGVWAVSSKYLIYIDAIGASGFINNVGYTTPLYGTSAITISSLWNGGAKFDIGSAINGAISAAADVNGISPISQGADYLSGVSLTTINFTNRKSVTIDTTAGAVSLSTFTGLLSGDKITIVNYAASGLNDITIASGLMYAGVANTIAPDTAKSYVVMGYPSAGRLIQI